MRGTLPHVTRTFPKHRSRRRDMMSVAYGLWILKAGSEVLFNRAYEAIAVRRPGQPGERMPPGIKSVGRIGQRHFHIGGVVNKPLLKQLLEIEIDFMAGREIQFPENAFPKERVKAPKEAPKKGLRLVASEGKLIIKDTTVVRPAQED